MKKNTKTTVSDITSNLLKVSQSGTEKLKVLKSTEKLIWNLLINRVSHKCSRTKIKLYQSNGKSKVMRKHLLMRQNLQAHCPSMVEHHVMAWACMAAFWNRLTNLYY